MTQEKNQSRQSFVKKLTLGVSGGTLVSGFHSFDRTGPSNSLIKIVYNNITVDNRLSAAWGFSAFIEYQDETLLFDTGGDASILLGNMREMNVNPARITSVVISHIHSDHLGGLIGLLDLGIQPTVYFPPSFPGEVKGRIGLKTEVVEVAPGFAFSGSLVSTGEMLAPDRPDPVEQSLIVKLDTGIVVLTGCAHPGIISILKKAQELCGDPILLAVGGFHLGNRSRDEVREIARTLADMGVQRCAPSHCTGDEAIILFEETFGDGFVSSALGETLYLS